jgi:hypothetical protein
MLTECVVSTAKARWYGAESDERESRVSEGTLVVPRGEERKDGRDHVISFALFSLPRRRSLLRGCTSHTVGTTYAIAIRVASIKSQAALHPAEARRFFTSAVQSERSPPTPRHKPDPRQDALIELRELPGLSVDLSGPPRRRTHRRALAHASQGRVRRAPHVRPRPPPRFARLACARVAPSPEAADRPGPRRAPAKLLFTVHVAAEANPDDAGIVHAVFFAPAKVAFCALKTVIAGSRAALVPRA